MSKTYRNTPRWVDEAATDPEYRPNRDNARSERKRRRMEKGADGIFANNPHDLRDGVYDTWDTVSKDNKNDIQRLIRHRANQNLHNDILKGVFDA